MEKIRRFVSLIVAILFCLAPVTFAAGGTVQPHFLSASTSFQWFPAISSDQVVWVDNRAGNLDIYSYDLSTGKETPVCTNWADQYLPKVYGHKVVWMDKRNMLGKTEKWDIYLYDLDKGQEIPICTSVGSHKSPSIWSNRIVWQDDRDGNDNIYLYDLTTGQERYVDGRTNFNFTDIYYYDLVLEKEFPVWVHNPNRPEAAGPPTIFGDKIVWDINHENGSSTIYMYTIPTGETSSLVQEGGTPQNRSSIYRLAIFGNWVAYTLYQNGVRRVKVYDLTTGQTFFASNVITGEDAPAVWGNELVWQDKSATFERIASAMLVSETVTTTTATAPDPQLSKRPPFFDIEDHWSKPWVLALFQMNIVHGMDDGTFRPDSLLTRAQFAQLLAGSLAPVGDSALTYSDVSGGEWFAPAVVQCTAAGWLEGFPDGTFRPQETLSKSQAIAALVRVVGLETMPGALPFPDVAGHWAQTDLETFFNQFPALLEKPTISYLSRGSTLEPDRPVSRGQTALFLAVALRVSATISF
jgi:beta propeller repeat protein